MSESLNGKKKKSQFGVMILDKLNSINNIPRYLCLIYIGKILTVRYVSTRYGEQLLGNNLNLASHNRS